MSTRFELTKALHDSLAPYLEALGFHSKDSPSDDPVYQIHFASTIGDSPHYRRFLRQSPLGYDTFECMFTQYSDKNSGDGFVGVGIDIGVHVSAFEELQLRLGLDMNPLRIGQNLPDVFHIEREIIQLKELAEVNGVVEKIMTIINNDGKIFWSKHTSLNDIQDHFQSWTESLRHSPKGGSHVSRYLLMIAYLKQDRKLFDELVKEYKPYMVMDVYENAFEALVAKLSKAFGENSH
jgi:hypothetical protein